MVFLFRITLLTLALLLLVISVGLGGVRRPPGPSLVAYMAITTNADIMLTWPGRPKPHPLIHTAHDETRPLFAPTCLEKRMACPLAFIVSAAPRTRTIWYDLHTALLDGSEQRKLTAITGQSTGLSWSPDGKWLALDIRARGTTEIYAIRYDGTAAFNISNHPGYDFRPQWSPDGSRIAFISFRHRPPLSNSEIYVATLDEERGVMDLRRLTESSTSDTLAGWSPDSEWLLYTSDQPPAVAPEIWLVRADGSGQHLLTDDRIAAISPVWSPDGSRIAFVAQIGGQSDVFTIRPDGSEMRNISSSPARDSDPVWSPDGQWIAFQSERSGRLDIYLVRPDGSDLHNLTDHPAADFSPSWSPDGQWITFESFRNGNRDIFAIRPDGSSLVRLSRQPGVDSSPSWSPPVEYAYGPAPLLISVGVLVIGALIPNVPLLRRRLLPPTG